MRKIVSILLVLPVAIVGCGDSGGGGDTGGDAGAGTGGTGGMDEPPNPFPWPPDATVHFDEYGLLSADCENNTDCTMVLGYYHAFHRFVQMDIGRRLATGRLADLVAPSVADLFGIAEIAARSRQLYSSRDGRPGEEVLLENASPETLAVLQAYSTGVNQWIADVQNGENGATWPAEFGPGLLDYSPEDVPAWTPADCLASILVLIEQLTNDEGSQINAGIQRALIGDDDVFSDLFSRRPINDSAIIEPPPAIAAATAPVAKRNLLPYRPYFRALPALRRLSDTLDRTERFRNLWGRAHLIGEDVGSNSWAVMPSNTENGNSLLSNDPHLGMEQPATWYIAHLDSKTNGSGTWHAAGATFAGLPWIILGQNEDVAWGATTTVMDFSDVYLEELVLDDQDQPRGVMFEGEVVDFIRSPFTVTFKDGSTEEFELLFTPHHGPVREVDVENMTAISLRWTGNDADTDVEAPNKWHVAGSVEEFRTAVTDITTIGQNWTVIDTQGNAGWYPYNRLPERTWATNLDGDGPPWLPLEGADGDYEWATYFDYEELPQVTNPEAG